MDSQDILSKMRDVYKTFRTYTDSGTVETSGMSGPGLEFETFFRRPAQFKFHWLSWHPYFGKSQPAQEAAVWTDGQKFKTKFLGQVNEEPNLSKTPLEQAILRFPVVGFTFHRMFNKPHSYDLRVHH